VVCFAFCGSRRRVYVHAGLVRDHADRFDPAAASSIFIGTSALLLIMALKFIGSGLMELQESHLLPDTDIGILPSWWEAIGLNPTWEALIVQGLVLAGVIGTFIVMHLRTARLSPVSGR